MCIPTIWIGWIVCRRPSHHEQSRNVPQGLKPKREALFCVGVKTPTYQPIPTYHADEFFSTSVKPKCTPFLAGRAGLVGQGFSPAILKIQKHGL